MWWRWGAPSSSWIGSRSMLRVRKIDREFSTILCDLVEGEPTSDRNKRRFSCCERSWHYCEGFSVVRYPFIRDGTDHHSATEIAWRLVRLFIRRYLLGFLSLADTIWHCSDDLPGFKSQYLLWNKYIILYIFISFFICGIWVDQIMKINRYKTIGNSQAEVINRIFIENIKLIS